jgi:hypothetical protein
MTQQTCVARPMCAMIVVDNFMRVHWSAFFFKFFNLV